MKPYISSIYQAVKSILSSSFYIVLTILLGVSAVLIIESHKHSYVWFFASAALTLLLLLLQEIRKQYRYLKDYARLNGEYRCWSYEYDRLVAEDGNDIRAKKLKDQDEVNENGSLAKIVHHKNNILKIVVTDSAMNVWEGYAVMESRDVGVLTFYYTCLGNNLTPWRRNGVRRIGILNDSNNGNPRICLFSELSPPHGIQRFGREILNKKIE
jgi:hypothetical protein